MPKIKRSKNCGNSPKNKLAEDIAIFIESGNSESLIEILAEDALWELADGRVINSDEVKTYVISSREKPDNIIVDQVLTHGKAGAVNGTIEIKNGALKRFCHVIEFSNTKCDKVRRLVSYGSS